MDMEKWYQLSKGKGALGVINRIAECWSALDCSNGTPFEQHMKALRNQFSEGESTFLLKAMWINASPESFGGGRLSRGWITIIDSLNQRHRL